MEVSRQCIESTNIYSEDKHHTFSDKTDYKTVYNLAHSITFYNVERMILENNISHFLRKFRKSH